MSYRPRNSECLIGSGGEYNMPRTLVSTRALALTSGTIFLTPFFASRSEAITKMRGRTGAAAAATVTTIKVGVYRVDDSGHLILDAVTANTTTMFGTIDNAGTLTNLTATWNKIQGRLYCSAAIFVGTTPPQVWGGSSAFPSTSAGNPFNTWPYDGPLQVTGQTDLVARIASTSLVSAPSIAAAPTPFLEMIP